jgi:hypothetical protein
MNSISIFPNTHKDTPDYQSQLAVRIFSHAIDHCILYNDLKWFAYLTHVLNWVYKNVIEWNNFWTNSDFIIYCTRELASCSVFECRRLLIMIDSYLENPLIQQSTELAFFQTLRNLVFARQWEAIKQS